MNAALRIRSETNRFLAVGEHVVDIDTLRLVTRPDAARLTPKAAAVLLQLAHAAGRTLSRDDLLNEVWKGTCPTPDVLTQAVKDLRRALGDDLHAPRYVETLPRLGYRLIAPARFVDAVDTLVSAAVSIVPAVNPPGASARNTSMRALPWRAAIVVLAAIAITGAITLFAARRDHAAPIDTRWLASEQRAITADPGPESFPRISPDGTRVAYSIGDAQMHNARIVQRSLAQSRVVRLTDANAGEEFYPVWSSDGAMIAFTRYSDERCRILVAPALGGPERLVDTCYTGSVDYFSWAPDAKHLLTTAPSKADATDMAIIWMPIDGGAPTRLAYDHSASDIDLDARYSPDGNTIAFRRGANPYSDLFVVPANGGAVRQLTHLASRIRGYDWTRDGTALVFSSGHGGQQALYTVSIDDGRIDSLAIQPAEFPSSARSSDTVVYEIPRLRTQLAVIALDDAAAVRRDIAPSTGSDGAPAFSPVDDRLAFVSDRSGSQQLWLYDPATDETFPLTDAIEPNLRYPAWRPDGARVLITARGEAAGSLIEVDIASRTWRTLTSENEDVRYGVYGSKPDTFIAVVGGSGQGRELIEFESVRGKETSRRVLARDVGRIDYDHVSAAVYFTRIAETGLYKLDPRTGVETLVTREINPAHLDGWTVLGGQVFHIVPQATGPSDVHVIDPVTGESRTVAKITDSVADMNLGVSHDGRQIVIVRAAARDTDVGAVTLRRKAAH